MSIIDISTPESLLSELLVVICEKLQISNTQQERAEQSANAVATYLESIDPGLRIEMYVQGSMALGTTVKPRKSEEYDVDLVVEVSNGLWLLPKSLYDWLWDALAANATYAKMIERKNRCVRINYSGEYHMDATPARPARRQVQLDRWGATRIEVPDMKKSIWSPSNPRGYVAWFEEQASESVLLQKRANIALPSNDPARLKGVLRQGVQLAKRARDCWFPDESDAPKSVVITTLLAHVYLGGADLYTGLRDALVSLANQLPEKHFYVANPTNTAENFAERWIEKPASYASFRTWLQSFAGRIVALPKLTGGALDNELAELFGESVAREARAVVAKRVADARVAGAIAAAGTRLTSTPSAGKSIPSNRFFGGDED